MEMEIANVMCMTFFMFGSVVALQLPDDFDKRPKRDKAKVR